MEKTFIPQQNLPALEKKMKKFAKKAVKRGFPAPKLHIWEEEAEVREVILENADTRQKIHVTYVPIAIEGEIPTIPGWNLIAAVEHFKAEKDGITYNTVSVVPSYSEGDFVHLRTAAPSCDHCGHNRFRKNTYLLYNSTEDEFKRVGSSCVKDFLGDTDPTWILNSASHLKMLRSFVEEFEGLGGGFQHEFLLDEVLAVTAATIRDRGWISKGKALQTGDAPTAEWVNRFLESPELMKREKVKVEEDDVKLGQAAFEWISSIDISDPKTSDYIYNCSVLAERKTIRSKDFGVACSIIASYRSHLARQIKNKEQNATAAKSEYVGQIKDRLKNIPVTFINAWSFDSSWGVCTVLKFTDEAGNTFIWYTGYKDYIQGNKYLLTGTIKKHNEFKGVKQTVVTRCKIQEA